MHGVHWPAVRPGQASRLGSLYAQVCTYIISNQQTVLRIRILPHVIKKLVKNDWICLRIRISWHIVFAWSESGPGSNLLKMLDQVLYKWIRITVNKHCIRSVSHILLHVRVHLCARLKLFAPGLVAQSCNSATGGQELWDGWRLLWPQPSGRK